MRSRRTAIGATVVGMTVPDKLEGLGLTTDGALWAVTDDDGVPNDNDGETLLLGSLAGAPS